jgi:uncharacterized peroxidase-related enzyme
MRLKKLEQVLRGEQVPDSVRTLSYRSEFFGKPLTAGLHEVLRGPSDWSAGERELFAGFVSRKNQCPSCTVVHGTVASEVLPDDVVKAVLDDWHSAPIDERLRVTLGFLEKVTLTPGEVGPDDVTPLRSAGVSDQAIEDALYVCAYINLIDRLANSFGFSVPPVEAIAQRAAFLLEHGYLQSIRPLP